MSNTEAPAEAGKQAKAAKAAKTVTVKITREAGHRHKGELIAKDETISVSERDAAIIVERLKAGELVRGN